MLCWSEPLEPRLLLHADIDPNGVLVVHQVTPGELANDAFVLSYDPTTKEVVVQHTDPHIGLHRRSFNTAMFNSIRVECGPGDDSVIVQGTGNRPITILCGDGNDVASIQNTDHNASTILGEAGNDTLAGGDEDDLIAGGEGDDQINGAGGIDTLIGDAGSDLLAGAGGDDLLFANDNARDTVGGGDGNDLADVDGLDVIMDTEERTGVQAPFFGGPWIPPTTVQAEDFDFGGEGIAYHVNDVTGSGGPYRNYAAVATAYQVVSFFPPVVITFVGASAGEWLEYTIDVPATGGYQIQTSAASNGPGGTFHYELDGTTITPPLAVPDTAGAFGSGNVSWGGISLPAGRHVLRLAFDTNSPTTGAVGEFDSINLVPEPRQPFNGTAGSIPGTIQAEQFDTGGEGVAFHDVTLANEAGQYRNTSVDIEASADTGGGFDLGYTKAGEWVEYAINVERNGVYVLSARVASDGLGGIFHVSVDGVNKTLAIRLPNTGGWQSWQTITRGVKLSPGHQVMRIVFDADGTTTWVGNINWIRIAPLEGDANLDGQVNFADYQALELAYGKAVGPWASGDFEGDGTSGNSDVRLLLANYGASINPSVPAEPVTPSAARSRAAIPPEPVVLPPRPSKPLSRTMRRR
jgi:hypothetical protein